MEAIPPLQGLTMLETSLSRALPLAAYCTPLGLKNEKAKNIFKF